MDLTRPLAAGIIGLSLLGTAAIGGQAYQAARATDGAISVTGSAQRRITSDQARWTVSLERSGGLDGLKEGNAQLSTDLKSVLAYLAKGGYSSTGVTVQPVSLSTLTNYGYNEVPVPTGFQLRQTIVVEGSDVAGITRLAAGSTELVNQGALLSTVSLEYVYTKLQDLRIEMLGEATANAKARAAEIAQQAGSRLGDLQEASTGVFQITPVNSTDISDYGSYDTTSIEKQITAVVRASFDTH
jgi:uncharacterized protein